MLGENRIGIEHAAAVERALGDDALPFAEQIGQHALIGHRDLVLAVGHFEADAQVVAANDAAVFHQSAEPDARAGPDVLFGNVARRIEEYDGIAERVEHQRNRDRQHAEPGADQNQASLLARHLYRAPLA